MKKIVFLDVDGTLVDVRQNIADSSKRAIEEARANGHKIVLCTGRTRASIYPWLIQIGFDGIVASSGANVFWGDEELHTASISNDDLKEVADVLDKHNAVYAFQGEDGRFMTQTNYDKIVKYFKDMGMGAIIEEFPNTITDKPYEAKGIESGIYINATSSVDEIQNDITCDIRVTGASFGHEQVYNGEINMFNINKATGMEVLVNHLGLENKDVIAFGDGLNDLEMIEYAHIGVAMGNAVPQLREIADMVTDKIDEDGVYNGFKKLKLI